MGGLVSHETNLLANSHRLVTSTVIDGNNISVISEVDARLSEQSQTIEKKVEDPAPR